MRARVGGGGAIAAIAAAAEGRFRLCLGSGLCLTNSLVRRSILGSSTRSFGNRHLSSAASAAPDPGIFIAFSQVISPCTNDSESSVLLSYEAKDIRKLLVVGVPEGLQRVASANRMRFGKLDHLFLTDLSASTFAGTAGMWLSKYSKIILNELDVPREGLMQLYGPKGLRYAHRYLRSFLKIKPDNLNDVSSGSLSLTFAPNHVIDVISVVAVGHSSYRFHLPQRRGQGLGERARASKPCFSC